jgi:hypothetical protein
MPTPPQSSTTVNLTAPITISSAVSDVTYNVTAAISGTAINLTTTGSLTRVVVRANNLAVNGVGGPGTVRDVAVFDATGSGFVGIKRFEGCVLGSKNHTDFRLTGSGVSLAPDAMIKSDDPDRFGIFLRDLSDSSFDGAFVALNAGRTSGISSATGIEYWENVHGTTANVMVSKSHAGYGVAIYRSTNNTVRDLLTDGIADPGLSIGGGAVNNVVDKATLRNSAIGLIIGEDVAGISHHNAVHTLRVENAGYGCVFLDRGSNTNTVGDAGGTTCINTGGADLTHTSSVWIANRPDQTGITPPFGNRVLGLAQSGTAVVPVYAVYLGPGTTENTVVGSATSWRIAKVLNEGLVGSLALSG